MGADLFLEPEFKEYTEPFRKEFNKIKAKAWQTDEEKKRLIELFGEMYGDANPFYFRDPYNNGSLLWRLGLSWWEDVDKLIDNNGILKEPEKFLEMLEAKEHMLNNIRDDAEREFFKKELKKLKDMLRRVIESNGKSYIVASI
ncbi:MAG: hypothetical protein DRP62_05225 [Planctomycetota bacterium]|nr:MAG: hypothetical protein DRP62_05225 [Planctomycetota bacterium]